MTNDEMNAIAAAVTKNTNRLTAPEEYHVEKDENVFNGTVTWKVVGNHGFDSGACVNRAAALALKDNMEKQQYMDTP